jgi:hypothetical protein
LPEHATSELAQRMLASSVESGFGIWKEAMARAGAKEAMDAI